ncbi:DUF2184 domain-containing protein [Cupriavidus sp. amp6]|uniref:DUF2184 domain-containing protein n=1 Tax=Cupriavidus sp. amp6 TaxID=388051 RepID=UPI00041AE102|nr:DUF2184 domain-containing protein [Cupriavidus sp. amp6]
MNRHTHYDEADLAAVQTFAPQMGGLREDESIFAARELDYVKARTYDRKLPPMKGLQLVPQTSEVPEWAETFTYRYYDQVGMAKIVANYADDLPRADVKGQEKTVRIKDIGDSYGYNISELRASMALQANLPTRKASAARRAVDVKLNQVAMVGDPDYGLFGLTTHPNIGVTVLPHGDWANPARTADEMLEDADALWNSVRLQSKGVHTPTMWALPSIEYSLLFSRRLPDSVGKTVGEFFKGKHPGLTIEEVPEFQDAGEGGTPLTLMYEFSSDNVSMENPMPFNQLPAQARNLELVVPCLARTAGVTVYYPLALTKAEI